MPRYAVVQLTPRSVGVEAGIVDVQWFPRRFDDPDEAKADAMKRELKAASGITFSVRELPEQTAESRKAQATVFAILSEHCGRLTDEERREFAGVITCSNKGREPQRFWTAPMWIAYAIRLQKHIEHCQGRDHCDALLAARDRLNPRKEKTR
jgi:hypothetical protein